MKDWDWPEHLFSSKGDLYITLYYFFEPKFFMHQLVFHRDTKEMFATVDIILFWEYQHWGLDKINELQYFTPYRP